MEESPSGAGSHKRTRPVEAAGAADAQTRPPRLGKHCAFSPSFHEEIKRRTRVVRIFPNPASCLRLVRALCAETHEGWLEDHRYLNMDFWKEQKKDLVRVAA